MALDTRNVAQLSRLSSLVIIVPEIFPYASRLLVQDQRAAIDSNAVYDVQEVTRVDITGCLSVGVHN